MAWQDLQDESPENLIEFIQLKDDPDFADSAEDAFKALMFGYQKELLKKLIPICRGWGYDDQVALEIGHKTFEKIWKYPAFDNSKTKLAMLFYLFGISSRLLADYKKNEEGEVSPFKGDEEIITSLEAVFSSDEPVERKAVLVERQTLIGKALERLGPKHRVIYLTYKYYEHLLEPGQTLSRSLLKKLRDELDLSQSSVRVYKNEAVKIVDDYLKIYGSK